VVIHQSYSSGLELFIDLLRHAAHPPGLKQERHQTWGASTSPSRPLTTRPTGTTKDHSGNTGQTGQPHLPTISTNLDNTEPALKKTRSVDQGTDHTAVTP